MECAISEQSRVLCAKTQFRTTRRAKIKEQDYRGNLGGEVREMQS